MSRPENLFAALPGAEIQEEEFLELAGNGKTRIERIVSQGHTSPSEGGWYDQEQDEWVLVLRGAAILEFEDQEVRLGPGDHLTIPAHTRHRVKWTDPSTETVWLAVHFG